MLELLARNLSNKEIARAMQIGEETIKWHLKNLFGKLDAGTRKQVVRRAQLLGLLEAGGLSRPRVPSLARSDTPAVQGACLPLGDGGEMAGRGCVICDP